MKSVPAPNALVSRDESVQHAALDQFYKGKQEEMQEEVEKRLEWWKRFTRVYNPVLAVCFVVGYWLLGLKHAEFW